MHEFEDRKVKIIQSKEKEGEKLEKYGKTQKPVDKNQVANI